MAIDYTSQLGQVRMNITDLNESAFLLSDDQINGLLSASGDSVNLATARALLIIATSTVLVSQKIKTQDLTTDGPAVAASLMDQAAVYQARADAEGDEVGYIGYAGSVPTGRLEAGEWPLW